MTELAAKSPIAIFLIDTSLAPLSFETISIKCLFPVGKGKIERKVPNVATAKWPSAVTNVEAFGCVKCEKLARHQTRADARLRLYKPNGVGRTLLTLTFSAKVLALAAWRCSYSRTSRIDSGEVQNRSRRRLAGAKRISPAPQTTYDAARISVAAFASRFRQ
jgi:hypothetical protein